jgi:hypothetical protein
VLSPFTNLDDLVARFVACRLPHSEWTHQAHLAVGAWHVAQFGADEALARLRVGIRRLNDSHGTPNSATRGYHETISRAYVVLLAEFLDSVSDTMPLAERVTRLLGSPLSARDALLQFYSRERLMSPEARATWIEPDVQPLRLAPLQDGEHPACSR